MKHTRFDRRMVIVGFGSIGQGVLPLLLRHIDLDPAKITIVTAEERGRGVAEEYNIRFIREALTPDNVDKVLDSRLAAGDFLLNVSVDVSSIALIEYCHRRDILYLDTCIEPWLGGYTDTSLSVSHRSNYAYREGALNLRNLDSRTTAVITHGANPGLVSHLVKRALLNIAHDTGFYAGKPKTRRDWAQLMEKLSVRTIHIAERDTQVAQQAKRVGEFVNTWSIEGFVGEGCQPSELGWGTHEKGLPHDGKRHHFGSNSAIYLDRPGASTRVRSWTPEEGPFHGFLITHGEAISIADYFTVTESNRPRFRPTVHYAYHPCDDAVLSLHELAGKNWRLQPAKRLMMNEIVAGCDELGVLMMGHAKGAYWFGSRLSIDEARKLAPHNNATSLQVTASVMAGVVWAIENPEAGLVEPDEMDFERILTLCDPYLGHLSGVYTDWTPIDGRGALFDEDIDRDDPWQFKNFRVL